MKKIQEFLKKLRNPQAHNFRRKYTNFKRVTVDHRNLFLLLPSGALAFELFVQKFENTEYLRNRLMPKSTTFGGKVLPKRRNRDKVPEQPFFKKTSSHQLSILMINTSKQHKTDKRDFWKENQNFKEIRSSEMISTLECRF